VPVEKEQHAIIEFLTAKKNSLHMNSVRGKAVLMYAQLDVGYGSLSKK